MNAIPPKRLAPDPQQPRSGEPEGVRLTIDFDDDPADAALQAVPPRSEPPSARSDPSAGDEAIDRAESSPRRAEAAQGEQAPRRAPGRSATVPAHLAAIEVTLSVEIGCHQIPLRDLLSVEPGQLVPLDRMTAEPVAILVNGRPFARGEVVAIGERYGVRLVEILESDRD